MKPTLGRIVLYCLTQYDAARINAQEDMNGVRAGQIYPMIVVCDNGKSINGQVFPDAHCCHWVVATHEMRGKEIGQGEWMWPPRVLPTLSDLSNADIASLREFVADFVAIENKSRYPVREPLSDADKTVLHEYLANHAANVAHAIDNPTLMVPDGIPGADNPQPDGSYRDEGSISPENIKYRGLGGIVIPGSDEARQSDYEGRKENDRDTVDTSDEEH